MGVLPSGQGATGATASSSGTSDGGASNAYNPVKASDFKTDDQLKRKRNPSEVKDRPNESKLLQEQTYMDADHIQARESDYVRAAECEACTKECECKCCDVCQPIESQTCTTVDAEGNLSEVTTCITEKECLPEEKCDCSVLPEIVAADIDDVSNVLQNNAELIALYGRDYADPPINRTANLHDAALDLIYNGVLEREYITRKRPILTYSGSNQGGPGKSPEDPKPLAKEKSKEFTQEGVGISTVADFATSGASIRGDNWVDGAGNPLTEEPPRVIARGSTTTWTSVINYPDNKDCDGNFFYPQGPIRHHQMPWTSERPHFVSFQNGVVNKYQPENYEYGKTYTRPLGLKITGIKFPDQDELPKPLCPKSPFKIVYVKRTSQNKRIFAKGWLSGTFDGEVYGAQYKYPRHGVNSFESVDRFIAKGDGLDRKGSISGDPVYTFHSPDTECDNSFIPATKCKSELALLGSGWRHGLYSEGKKPTGDQWTGTQKDNRGARVSNNLNHYSGGGGESNIVGITFAPANTVVSPASGMSKPLMNRFRESSVYLQTSGNMAGDGVDKSFVGDVLDHFAPTTANAPYVALFRDIPDQYGSVQGLKYCDLGLVATEVHAQGTNAIEGICGDAWIGPYSKRRTSYVSNKQGDFFNPPMKEGSPCRERSWCDSPDDKIFQYFGIDHYPTKLPKSGDLWDPKNYAGLHTIGGECGDLGKSKTAAEAAGAGASESDFYWPRTLKSLVHTVVESHVNPWLRETGEGSQVEDGKVYYPKLKDLYLDADAPTKHPWEESFLSRFYAAIEQPSKKKLWMKMMFRTFLNGIMPMGMLTQFQNMEGVLDTLSTFMVSPMLMAFWILGTNTLFTDRRLNQILGIGDCLRDEEGGDLDEMIENFEDAYSRYNWDYSKVNDIQPYYAFPLPYNTCDCDECLAGDTEVIMSDKSKKTIKDINIGDKVLSYDFETNSYIDKRVTSKWDRGTKDLYRIHFRNGSHVDATGNHKWFVENAWNNYRTEIITTDELIESRKLPSNSKCPKYVLKYAGNLPNKDLDFLNESEAYIIGMYIAEGSRPHTNDNWKPTFMVSQLNQPGRDKLEAELKNTRFSWKEHQKGFYLSDTKDLVELFLEVNRGACNKNIPHKLFHLSKNLLEKLYEGLMDGDGTRKGFSIDKNGFKSAAQDTYYTCSETLIHDFAILANMIGKPGIIRSGIRSGFGSKKLQYRFDASEQGWLKVNNRLYIKDIEEIDQSDTYDIEVEDTNSFILAKSLAISHNCNKSQTNNEIYHTNKQNLDTEIDAYRNIKINNYNELPASSGKLQRLFVQGQGFYAHTTDGIWLLQLRQEAMSDQIAFQQSGTGELLAEPQMLFEGVEEGFAGTQHPNAGINTSFGYFFIDDNAHKVYRFNGSPEEISAYGMYHFFKENLGFCDAKACYDEKTSGGIHYALGWDPRYNRLLVTKQDGSACNSFTISYTPLGVAKQGGGAGGKWISFHDYKPQAYLWDRNSFFSVLYGSGQVWRHHVKGSYQTFYGQAHPFEVQFNAIPETLEASNFEYLILDTEAEIDTDQKYPKKDIDATFNKVAIWNSSEGTGTLPIVVVSDNFGKRQSQLDRTKQDYSKVRFYKEKRVWRANEIKNLVDDDCENPQMVISACGCEAIPSVNEEIFNCSKINKQDFVNRKLSDKFLTYRYTLDNRTDMRLYVRLHKTFDDSKQIPKQD